MKDFVTKRDLEITLETALAKQTIRLGTIVVATAGVFAAVIAVLIQLA